MRYDGVPRFGQSLRWRACGYADGWVYGSSSLTLTKAKTAIARILNASGHLLHVLLRNIRGHCRPAGRPGVRRPLEVFNATTGRRVAVG